MNSEHYIINHYFQIYITKVNESTLKQKLKHNQQTNAGQLCEILSATAAKKKEKALKFQLLKDA